MTIWTYVAGWTLVHFVWQGALIALGTAAALRLLTRADARARYALACSALALMLAAPLVTATAVVRSLPDAPAGLTLSSTPSAIDASATLTTSARTSATSSRTIGMLGLDGVLPIVVVGWLAGVVVLFARLLGGAWRVQRLRRDANALPPSRWQDAADRVAARLGLARVVRVIDVSAIDTPTVVGWLRPVILLPVAALANLTPEQVEAILAHELAHIRRHDVLVNLLQTIAETLLFYHPAVWWVSSQIRTEREHCCDDVAVMACGDAVRYAEALTELATWSAADRPLVMAATHRPLLARIRRILAGTPASGSRTTVVAAVITAILLGAGVAVTASARIIDNPYVDDGREPASVAGQISRILNRAKPPAPAYSLNGDPTTAHAWGVAVDYPGGRMPFIGYTGRSLIRYAYDMPDVPIIDGPDWLDAESFEFTATTSAVAPTEADLRDALRTALEQRLHLLAHADNRDLPVLALTRAGGSLGPNIHPADGSCFTEQMLREAREANRPLPSGQRTPLCGVEDNYTGPIGRGVTLDAMAQWLQHGILRQRVVDRTGLKGRYDYTLDLGLLPLAYIASSQSWTAAMLKPFGVTPLPDALRDQLGLTLQNSTAPYDVFVIDHVERPGNGVGSHLTRTPSVQPQTSTSAQTATPRDDATTQEIERRLRDLQQRATAAREAARAAAAQAAAQQAAAQSGLPGQLSVLLVDPLNNWLPGVRVTIAAADGSTLTATTDRQGLFAIDEIAPGRYGVKVSVPGFQDFSSVFDVRPGERTDVTFPLALGTLRETITVIQGAPPVVGGAQYSRPAPPPSGVLPSPRMGGNIKPPTKVKHVSPVYPVSGTEGIVYLTAVIDRDGTVKNVQVLASPADDLSQAAIDAIARWEFTPTLLDGEAVDVVMNVTVQFQRN